MAHATENEPQVELPDDVEQMLAADGAKKKRRAGIVMFVVIPLLVIGGGAAWWHFGKQAAARDIKVAWDRASACLVGNPLAEGELASLRMRQIQLNAVRTERDKKTGERWPNRCADYIAELNQALRKHGEDKDGEEGLAQQAETFAIAVRKMNLMADASAGIDGLFKAADARGLKAEAVSLTVPSPDPEQALTLDNLPESARITDLQYTLDRVSSTKLVGTEVHALVYDKGIDPKPILCTFRETSGDTCRALGGELAGKSGLRLGGTVDEGASPLIFVGRNGEEGIYRSDTLEKVTALRAQSAYVSKDGYVAIASRALDGDGQFDLIQQAGPKQEPQKTRIKPSVFRPKVKRIHRKRLLWGKLLVQVLDDSKESLTMRLQSKQLPAAKPNSEFFDIAPIGYTRESILGCKTHDGLVVRVGGNNGFVSFLKANKWSTPVPLESAPRLFTCDRGEAVFTAPAWQVRCTSAGCKNLDGELPSFEPFPARKSSFTDLDAKFLSVALTDERGGLRYRHAEGKNMQLKGADSLMLDDLVYDGKVQSDTGVLGMVLAGRGRFAVILLSTRKGLYALRFGADGKAKPAIIKR